MAGGCHRRPRPDYESRWPFYDSSYSQQQFAPARAEALLASKKAKAQRSSFASFPHGKQNRVEDESVRPHHLIHRCCREGRRRGLLQIKRSILTSVRRRPSSGRYQAWAIRNTQAFAAYRASPLTRGFGPRKMDCHDRHSNVPFDCSCCLSLRRTMPGPGHGIAGRSPEAPSLDYYGSEWS